MVVDGHAREHIVGGVEQRHLALGAAVGDFRPRGAARLECLFVLEDRNHPMTLAKGDELSATSNVNAPLYLSYKTNMKGTLQNLPCPRPFSPRTLVAAHPPTRDQQQGPGWTYF